MTKRDAEQTFRADVLSAIRKSETFGPDYPVRTEAWNNFTDSLCKEGMITEDQCDTWDYPDCCLSPGEKQDKRHRKIRLVSQIMLS